MTASDTRYTVLVNTLYTWDRRWRIKKLLIWLPRMLLVPLVFGIVMAIIGRFSPIFALPDILYITILATGAFLLGFIGFFLFRKRDPIQVARYFDLEFGLQERVSTALELITGAIQSDDRLVVAQIADAQDLAQNLAYKQRLKWVIHRLDWAIVLGVCVILAILHLLPNPNSDTLALAQAQQAQIDQSAETVKDIIQDIANNPTLDSATREQLLRELTVSLQTLQNPQISTEEALATLSDMQNLLEETAQNISQRTQAEQEALQRALEALQNSQNQAQSLSEALTQVQQNLAEQPSQTTDDAQLGNQDADEPPSETQNPNNPQNPTNSNNSSASANQAQADALRQAARELAQINPNAAQSLEQAADALENGDIQGAQEALRQAQEHLNQPDSANDQQNQQLAQNLQQSAQQMQQQAQQLAQSQQQHGNQQNQQSAQQNQQAQNSQGGQPQQGQQNQSQNPQGDNAGNSDQQGDAQGQQSDNPSQSDTAQLGQSQNSNQQQPSQQTQGTTLDSNTPTDNRGGDNQADLSQDTSGLNLTNPEQGEGQGGEDRGQGQYEVVFAPLRLGGENDGEDIILAPDTNTEPLREGNFSDNERGNITVPYNQVFDTYLQNANTALNAGYIPLGMRDVIRQYFTSLAPRTSNTTQD